VSPEPESAHRSEWPVSDVDESAHRSEGRHHLIDDTQIIQVIPAMGPVLYFAEFLPTWRRRHHVAHLTHARYGVEQFAPTVRVRTKRFWWKSSAERYLASLHEARNRVYSAVYQPLRDLGAVPPPAPGVEP